MLYLPRMMALLVGVSLALAQLTACSDDDPSDSAEDVTQDVDAVDGEGDAADGEDDSVDGRDDVTDADASDGDSGPSESYRATIRYTSYGVPHVMADEVGSLSFGVGYAQARDHICVLADQYAFVNSRRASYFGPGETGEHLDSDFGFLNVGIHELAASALPEQDEEIQRGLRGFAAGYNYYLEEVGPEGLPAACRGADWVTPITVEDVFTLGISFTLFSSARPLIAAIGSAQPPTDEKSGPGWEPGQPLTLEAPDFRNLGLGSNGWGIGGDLSETGRGLVMGNPHFPWHGELQFWENHQTIRDEANVYGASLLGSPVVNIGFNEHLAWTHTVSASQRFTAYSIALGDTPTTYLEDGEPREMTARDFTIDVRQPDGSVEPMTRTMYRTHYGPVINIAPLGWSHELTLTYRDANQDNTVLAEHWLQMGRASNLDEFIATHRDLNGIPFVNTMYADAAGNALYLDSTQVPNLSEDTIERWQAAIETDVIVGTAWRQFGFVLLDGSDSRNEWVEAAGARLPGNVPFDEAPQLLRRDFVANANNPHWAANPNAFLEGYSRMYGAERVPLATRPRTNLMYLTETGSDRHSGEDGLWSLDELHGMFYGGRTYLATDLLADVVSRCEGVTDVVIEVGDGEETVDISAICSALGGWDGRFAPASTGAAAWREWVAQFGGADIADAGRLFGIPFDPDDPVNTPGGLADVPAEGPDPVLVAMAQASQILEQAGIEPDAELQSVQLTGFGDGFISVPGGNFIEGMFNIVVFGGPDATLLPQIERGEIINRRTGLTEDGYICGNGSSFVMSVSFTDEGPVARGVLTFSQSDDPDSLHHQDQLPVFSETRFRPMLFLEEDILADPELEVIELELN